MSDESAHPNLLRLGTRGSQLARWQAEWVAGELRRLGHAVDLVEIATRGDAEQTSPIEDIGTRGVFTKEIQRALLAGDVDLGVHSLKDLPTEPVGGLVLAAVPTRESAADVLVLPIRRRTDNPVRPESSTDRIVRPTDLPHGARVGTGSLRRQAQLRHVRPDLRIEDVRGNVDTRLRKLDDGQFDAIVLAEAGLRRLGLAHRATLVLPVDVMLPAVGQGALGIECRMDDAATCAALMPLENAATRAAVTAERALLAHLRGGCMAPVGAWGRIENGELLLSAVVLSVDGRQRLQASESAAPDDAIALGQRVAELLLARGAGELIAASRKNQLRMKPELRELFDAQLEVVLPELPEQVQKFMDTVPLVVEDHPSREVMRRMRIRHPSHLYGLYTGIPLIKRSVDHSGTPSDVIHIFRLGILSQARRDDGTFDQAELRNQIRRTILHEYGHHVGLSERDLRELGYG